jgi:hypothetical protein
MNLVTLLNRTLRLGFWGGSTLYHMAACLLVGLLLLLFPEEVLHYVIETGVVGVPAIEGSSSAMMSPLVANAVARLMGFQLAVVGLLFGMFGSVADHKARTRLNYFAMASYVGGITFHALHLYLRTGILRREVLVAGILSNTFGLCLVFVCLYFLAFDHFSTTHAASKKQNKSS